MHEIQFVRAKGQCEQCSRPHGRVVLHLGDGRWWDEDAGRWHCDCYRQLTTQLAAAEITGAVRWTRVYLATAHRSHDTSVNDACNLAA